mmetsp:Transcript_98278/g.302976  ORF Transcript_98278/g.302976 Transcript_98278/m.302976 type:complete len:263 (+) Transcript_98278:538-1326(+)
MPHSSRMSASVIISSAAMVSKPLSTNLSKYRMRPNFVSSSCIASTPSPAFSTPSPSAASSCSGSSLTSARSLSSSGTGTSDTWPSRAAATGDSPPTTLELPVGAEGPPLASLSATGGRTGAEGPLLGPRSATGAFGDAVELEAAGAVAARPTGLSTPASMAVALAERPDAAFVTPGIRPPAVPEEAAGEDDTMPAAADCAAPAEALVAAASAHAKMSAVDDAAGRFPEVELRPPETPVLPEAALRPPATSVPIAAEGAWRVT